MRLTRTLAMVLLLGVLSLVPTLAFAADATFFGPIIPKECHCPKSAPDWGCVMQVIQNGINFTVSMGIIIFTLVIAYAGAMYMASAANPKQHSDAVKMAQNVVLGLLVLLSAWLLVDFVMKVLYDAKGSGFGPWEAILADGDSRMCLEPITQRPQAPGMPGGDGSFAVGDSVTCNAVPGVVTAIAPAESGNGQVLSVEFPAIGDGSPTTRTNVASTECVKVGGPTVVEEEENSTGEDNNCGVDDSSMIAFAASVTLGSTERATADTIERFMRMRTAALQDDIDLKVVDAYRSDAEQLQIWNSNGCNNGSCSGEVAKPCSLEGGGSNHVTGQALDLNIGCSRGQTGCNTRSYNWLKQNGAQYGFRNSLPSDPVHWSPTGR